MLSGKRILISGVTGKAVLPIAQALARDNEVFGLARFADPEQRRAVEALGIIACPADLGAGDFDQVPADIDHLLHFGWMRADLPRLQEAIRVNVEGAGLLLQHCRNARSVLVVSSMGMYARHPDPLHLFAESDPIGAASTAYAQTSPVCKLGLEAVARFCARAFDLPVTIARLNTVLGPGKAYHGAHFDAVREGREVMVPSNPNAHSPIHNDDMILQIEPLLDAAARTAFTVNWCGDEVAITQETLARTGEIVGREPRIKLVENPCAALSNAADPTRRRSVTGPCTVRFWEGFERLGKAKQAEAAARG